MVSGVNIETAPFEVLGELFDGGSGMDRSGVQGFVALKAHQLHQLARALAQVVEREGVTQRVRGDVHAVNPGPPRQMSNDRLNGTGRHRSAALACAVAFSGTSRALRPLPSRKRTSPERSRAVVSAITAVKHPPGLPSYPSNCPLPVP